MEIKISNSYQDNLDVVINDNANEPTKRIKARQKLLVLHD